MVFICGEIKDLVSDSDKHYAYLEDPYDVGLTDEFNGLDEDEVEDLKREYVLPNWYSFCFADILRPMTTKLGTQPHSRPRTQPPHPQLPEEDRRGIA